MMITDALIKELEEAFSSNLVHIVAGWDETCRLQGSLNVIQWLKDKQDEQNARALVTTESPVTIRNNVEPRIIGAGVKNASFLDNS